jgi:hypothetical protein
MYALTPYGSKVMDYGVLRLQYQRYGGKIAVNMHLNLKALYQTSK